MRKNIAGLVSLVLIISLFTSCGSNKNIEQYITEGKIAMANEEYDKARKLFKLAVDEEKKENVEYLELLKVSEGLLRLEEISKGLDFLEFDECVQDLEGLETISNYREEFDDLVTKIKNNKEEFEKNKLEIEMIDKLKKDGELDRAKNKAEEVLKKVKQNELIREQINKKIEEIEKIIKDAGNRIKEIDKLEKEIKYYGVKNTSEGGYDKLKKLKGKRMLHFMEVEESSAKDYMYDLKTGDIYNFNQGDIYHINTGEKVFDGIKYAEELEEKKRIEEEKKMLETKKASEELFYGLEHIEKNKHGVQTEALIMEFGASEFDISVVLSTWHLQRGDGENGETIDTQDVTQEMVNEGRILARGDSFNGIIDYIGNNVWTGTLSNSGQETNCKIRKVSKGKYEITVFGKTKTFTTIK